MPTTVRKQRRAKKRIVYIPITEISPNPSQPRRFFDETGLEELAESIGQYGLLNPLTVRLRGGKYELVAGERRLRAASLAGLYEVPCILIDVNMEESSLLALVENLQRQDLDFIEQAEGISQLIRIFGMSQEEAARRLGKSQSAVANKLRLLRLPPDVLDSMRKNALSERHGRALLRLPTVMEQRAALAVMVEKGMNVSQAESYVAELLSPAPDVPEQTKPRKTVFVLKDVRVFLNTLSRGLEVMKKGGINADMRREETEGAIVLTISIPKGKS
jgi:ParB family chromosome partitioning protein